VTLANLRNPLRDDTDLFRTAHASAGGSNIAWGEDGSIDLSASTIERLADEAMSAKGLQRVYGASRVDL